MVTRKPVPGQLATPTPAHNASASSNPPYPTTPTSDTQATTSIGNVHSIQSDNPSTFDLIDMQEGRKRSGSGSDISSHGTWNSDDDESDDDDHKQVEPTTSDIPKPLRITPVKQVSAQKDGKDEELPASLRVGLAGGASKQTTRVAQQYDDGAQSNPWQGPTLGPVTNTVQRPVVPNMVSNNPYRQQNGYEPQNSQTAWQEVQSQPPAQPPPPPPVELPAVTTPSKELAQMSLGEGASKNSNEYKVAEILPVPPPLAPPLLNGGSEQAPSSNPISTLNPWQDDQPWYGEGAAHSQTIPPAAPPAPPIPAPPLAVPVGRDANEPSIDLLSPGPPLTTPGSLLDHQDHAQHTQATTDATTLSGRPGNISIPNPAATRSTDSVPETPGAQMRRQKNEHYQIKNVRWLDGPAMRTSPVLTQNANGPCPLLALVNALVLSTPPNVDTALIETLRTREQVSLGLLLDAVFDELMSGRRGDNADGLPDVSDLYAFLLALHTGMNVNPRFVASPAALRNPSRGNALRFDQVHPLERPENQPGSFEETREMRLYSTFNVPLIHGWTAPKGTPAFDAFERSAQTFEDAQNIQFSQAELEDKLQSEGLSSAEQQTLQDVHTIKSFLESWPTQLTDHGLQMISSSLKLGQIAILFRNDHFSTLYKESKHGALMTLVTDAGYSSHDEIVWESLVDVNGAASELVSGDFRTVSHQQDARLNQSSSAGGEEGWQTVPSTRWQEQRQNAPHSQTILATSEAPPPLPGPRPLQEVATTSVVDTESLRRAAEQEDHDLALALQLQEEEEDQQRQADQRRRREQELSEQFLSTESSEGPRPTIPPRRGTGRNTSTTNVPVTNRPRPNGRPAVNRPADQDDPEAPPSYEQAATDRPYRPAGSTAPGMQGSPLTAYDALRQQQNAMSTSSLNSTASPAYHARQRSDGNRIRRRDSQLGGPGLGNPSPQRVNQAANVHDAEERCSVM